MNHYLNNCKNLRQRILYIRIFNIAYTVFGINKHTLDRNKKYHSQEIKIFVQKL